MKFRRSLFACLLAYAVHGMAMAGSGQTLYSGHGNNPAEPPSCAADVASSIVVADAPDANTYAVYRVSQANADEVRAALPGIAMQSGVSSTTYRYFELIADQMADALASGSDLLDDRDALGQVIGHEAMDTDQEPLFVERVRFRRGAECTTTCVQASDLLLCDVARTATPMRR